MITPNDSLKLTPDDEKLIKKCEQQIDAGLSERTSDKYVTSFSPPLRLAVAEELKKRYEAAGWKVEHGLRAEHEARRADRQVTSFTIEPKP